MALAQKPVVFSHANVRNLVEHRRNIDDEQIAACARTDGVIGVNGIGLFLGGDIETDSLLRHIDYLAAKVGPRHVGLGLDYSFVRDHSDLPPGEEAETWWPKSHGYDL